MSIPRIAISNEDDLSLRIVDSHLKANPPSSLSSPQKSIIKTRTSQPQSPTSSTTTQSFHTCYESFRQNSLSTSIPLKRSYTISHVKNPSAQQRLRRIHSYQLSPRRRRSTAESMSVYETPEHDENSLRLVLDTDCNYNNQNDMQIETGIERQQPSIGVGFLRVLMEIKTILSLFLTHRFVRLVFNVYLENDFRNISTNEMIIRYISFLLRIGNKKHELSSFN